MDADKRIDDLHAAADAHAEAWDKAKRIDNAAEVNKHLSNWKHLVGNNLEVDMQMAQVYATLALAEQQRIANLIALEARWGAETGDSLMCAVRDEDGFLSAYRFNSDIAAALGIEQGENDE